MARLMPLFIRNMCTGVQSIKPPMPVFGVEGRYVSALYSAAHQLNQLEAVEEHFKKFQKVISKPSVIDFFENSMIARPEKAKILQEIAAGAGMPDTATRFLGVVAENGRLKMLKKMINTFLAVMVAHRNEAQCEVITAAPLDEGARKSLIDTLQKFVKQGKKITLTEKVDPSIIGGMIVGIEDKHVDLSISRKIQMYTDLLKQAV